MPQKIKKAKNLIVGLDIGTTKVVALVGEVTSDGQVEIIGVGTHSSRGLKKGIVVNIDATVQSIQKAIEEAEFMAGCEITSAYTGIAGSHIRSINSNGIVAIRNREITQADVDRVIDAARTIAIPADQKILHILPQEFVIDDQEGVREPIGMSGVRLEAKVHVVTGGISAAQNIVKCVERCNLRVSDIILQQLASSAAVLTDDEKELGACLVDIGGGTTDIAIFTDGAIRHSLIIPIAGNQLTNDIAVTLRIPTKQAEEIKIKHACALSDSVDEGEVIDLGVSQYQPQVFRKTLAEIVEARYEELFNLILTELKRSNFYDVLAGGMVLTGGAAKMAGITELAERVLQMPVRVGSPQNVSGMTEILNNPIYSTGVGLLLTGYQHQREDRADFISSNIKNLFARMKGWFQRNF